jgi:hypothetical protein
MVVWLSEQKPPQRGEQNETKSIFSSVPAGLPRSAAEYLSAALTGAILLFAFFLAAEASVVFLPGSDLMPATFLPVICILPILAGAVSALALERMRAKPLFIKRGAMVGFLSGFLGALLSSLMLGIAKLLSHQPFGKFVPSGWMVLFVLAMVVALDSMLAAMGGAIAAKLVKDI